MKKEKHETITDFKWRKARHKRIVKEYSKFLEDDFEGDWSPIIRLLIFKLKRNRDSINKYARHENYKKYVKEMDVVIKLLERIEKEDYHAIAFKDFYKKYGKSKMITIEPTPEEVKSNPYCGGQIEFLYRGKPATKEMSKEQHKLYKLEEELINDDLKEAFSLMAKNIRNWWD